MLFGVDWMLSDKLQRPIGKMPGLSSASASFLVAKVVVDGKTTSAGFSNAEPDSSSTSGAASVRFGLRLPLMIILSGMSSFVVACSVGCCSEAAEFSPLLPISSPSLSLMCGYYLRFYFVTGAETSCALSSISICAGTETVVVAAGYTSPSSLMCTGGMISFSTSSSWPPLLSPLKDVVKMASSPAIFRPFLTSPSTTVSAFSYLGGSSSFISSSSSS